VIGLGTQDSFGEAEEFVDRYGTTFTMLWDETFESWQAFGVTAQPAAILFSADGRPLQGWLGPFPEDEVLRLAGI
jgi:peroxiredoxin